MGTNGFFGVMRARGVEAARRNVALTCDLVKANCLQHQALWLCERSESACLTHWAWPFAIKDSMWRSTSAYARPLARGEAPKTYIPGAKGVGRRRNTSRIWRRKRLRRTADPKLRPKA